MKQGRLNEISKKKKSVIPAKLKKSYISKPIEDEFTKKLTDIFALFATRPNGFILKINSLLYLHLIYKNSKLPKKYCVGH